MAPWPLRAARALDRDENSRVIVENLDQVIRWITGRPSDATSAMDLEVEKLGLEPSMARTRALIIINRMMLRRQDPWAVLGVRRGTDVADVRVRYKRLMQVFHPDRGFADSDWLSDCTARLHWAHDAIRKAPASKSGFSTGFSKRQRSKPQAPPPWRHKDPVVDDNDTNGVANAEPQHEASPSQRVSQAATESTSGKPSTASGVWRFPGGGDSQHADSDVGAGSSDAAALNDAEYLQAQARRTTASVETPEFVAEHHDGDADGPFNYDSVFQQSIDTRGRPAGHEATDEDYADLKAGLVDDADVDDVIEVIDDANDVFVAGQELETLANTDDSIVDVFEQAAPTTEDYHSSTLGHVGEGDATAQPKREWSVNKKKRPGHAVDSRSRFASPPAGETPAVDDTDANRESVFAPPVTPTPIDTSRDSDEDDGSHVEERLVVERTKEMQSVEGRVRALADKDRQRAIREKIEREKAARAIQVDAKLKKEQERQAKRDEKARRRLQRYEYSLEKKRLKELKKQEKIKRKQLELHKQRNDVEAAERTRREERQRARAEAKERAEAESERRRLKELDKLHREEAAAVAAQRAREAQRRRRHLEAEGNRLSSISDRSPRERPVATESTLPPWHERARELSRRHQMDAQAQDRRARMERRAELQKQVSEQWQEGENKRDSASVAARTVRASNVEPLRNYRQQVAQPGSPAARSSRGETAAATATRRVQRVTTSRGRQRTGFEGGQNREPSARLTEQESARVKHAANDDSVGTPAPNDAARYAVIAAVIVGLIGVGAFLGQKFTTDSGDDIANVDRNASIENSSTNVTEVVAVTSADTAVQVQSPPDAIDPQITAELTQESTGSTTTTSAIADAVKIDTAQVTEAATDATGVADAVVAQDVVLANTDASRATDDDSRPDLGARDAQPRQNLQPPTDSNAEPNNDRADVVAAAGIQTRQETSIANDDITALIRGIPISRDTQADVQAINDLLRNSYIDGDAAAFASLFADDGVMNQFKGASTIQAALSEVFQATNRRHLYIEVARIDELGEVYSLHGRLSTVLRFDDGTSKLSDSNLRMSIAAQDSRLVIKSLSY